MADFSPFAGVRYQGASARLAALVAPPYDVIDDDQLATLEAMDEHNSVRLILPRDEVAEGDRYARAAATFGPGWTTACSSATTRPASTRTAWSSPTRTAPGGIRGA